jgi:hypothetical protein
MVINFFQVYYLSDWCIKNPIGAIFVKQTLGYLQRTPMKRSNTAYILLFSCRKETKCSINLLKNTTDLVCTLVLPNLPQK